jgi:hypothetical protein
LPITAAINVATTREESETDRKIKSLTDTYHHKNFDLVTVQGTLKVRNFEKRAVDVVIAAKVTGKPLSASDAGVLTTNAQKLVLTEREGTVTWKLSVEPGATTSVEYRY